MKITMLLLALLALLALPTLASAQATRCYEAYGQTTCYGSGGSYEVDQYAPGYRSYRDSSGNSGTWVEVLPGISAGTFRGPGPGGSLVDPVLPGLGTGMGRSSSDEPEDRRDSLYQQPWETER